MSRTAGVLASCFALCFAVLVAKPALAPGSCPASSLQLLWSAGEFQSTTAASDSSYTPAGFPTQSSAAYDLVTGELSMFRNIGGVSWTYVRARDLYDVAGVAAGAQVALTAQLDVDGYVQSPGCGGSGCGGTFGARIRQGAALVERSVTFPNVFLGGQVSLRETLQLPIVISAGTPESLEFELYVFIPAGGSAGGAGSGKIHWSGVPAGAHIVSCQGFADSATPAWRTSWGNLKTLYR